MKTIPYHEIQETLNKTNKLTYDPTALSHHTMSTSMMVVGIILLVLCILTFFALFFDFYVLLTLSAISLLVYFIGLNPMLNKDTKKRESIDTQTQVISQKHYLKAYNLSESTSASTEHSNFILAGSSSAKLNSSIDYVVYQTVDHTFDSGFQLKQYPSDDKYNPVVVHEIPKDDKTKPYVERLTTIKWYRDGDDILGYQLKKSKINMYVPEGAIVTNQSFDTNLVK